MRHVVNGASFQSAGIRGEKKPGGSLRWSRKSPTIVGPGQRFGIDPDEGEAAGEAFGEAIVPAIDPDADDVAVAEGSLAIFSSALAFLSAFFCFLALIFLSSHAARSAFRALLSSYLKANSNYYLKYKIKR